MGLPLRTTVFWQIVSRLERRSVMQLPADRVRAASDARKRLVTQPGAWLLMGRPDKQVAIEDISFTTPDGVELGLRVYRPRGSAGPRPVVLNFHGGGFVSGDPRQSEWWCAGVAAAGDVVVVSPDYRLAPEDPFPAGVEDCYAATTWVVEHASQLGIDGTRVAVMGDSAGGTLAAVVSIMARDRGGPAIALQILMYPAVDFVGEYASKAENANAPVLTRKDIDNVERLYLSGPDNDPKNPLASPVYADHHDLPPAVIQTAQYDPLRDQGSAYAAALREAGVPVRLTNYVQAVHGFISLPNVTVGAKQAMGEAVAALHDAFEE